MDEGASPAYSLKAGVGMHVDLVLITETGTEPLAVDIVPDSSADFARGFLGEGTPLAQAIQGKAAGNTVPYHAGDIHTVKILSVQPSTSLPPPDVAERREATIRKAVDESDRTNAIIFASSFSGKWGDYDPDGIGKTWEKPALPEDNDRGAHKTHDPKQ